MRCIVQPRLDSVSDFAEVPNDTQRGDFSYCKRYGTSTDSDPMGYQLAAYF